MFAHMFVNSERKRCKSCFSKQLLASTTPLAHRLFTSTDCHRLLIDNTIQSVVHLTNIKLTHYHTTTSMLEGGSGSGGKSSVFARERYCAMTELSYQQLASLIFYFNPEITRVCVVALARTRKEVNR